MSSICLYRVTALLTLLHAYDLCLDRLLPQVRQAEFHPTQPWVVSATKSHHVCVWDWVTQQVGDIEINTITLH